ncbi:MAG: ATP-binding protein [Verrucomicrobiales bacterium]
MASLFTILELTVGLLALAALILLGVRLHRARKDFEENVAAWKVRLDLDLSRARKERDQLLDALAESFLLIDANSRIIFANKAASAMFAGRELIQRTVTEVFLNAKLAEPMLECLETREPTVTRIELPPSTFSTPEHDQIGILVLDVDVSPISETPVDSPIIRVVIRDVSAEHHTEQIRKDFVANASHELRTPLTIINGYLANLIDDELVEDPEITRRFLKIMRKHSERIARIVEDMLVISRLESGEASALKIKRFRMRSCIQDVLERLESMIRNQNATITVEMPDEKLKIHGDRFYWTQVLFNLIENALKQNPRSGLNIRVGCIEEDNQIRLWVSDDGVGIPTADLNHIFRRFYRVAKHHSQEEIKGTGLGLSIVKRAVEAHAGSISVSSVPGEETRFTIVIPRRQRKDETEDEEN